MTDFIDWTEKRLPNIQEALIGSLFILAANGGILLLAGNPHGSEHLRELLVGQILWSTWESLVPVALLYAGILTVWFGFRDRFGPLGFYMTFAIVVTASVQIVGIILLATFDLPTGAIIVWSMAAIAILGSLTLLLRARVDSH